MRRHPAPLTAPRAHHLGVFLLALAPVSSCATGARPATVGSDVVFTDAAYCDVARLPGLVDWSGGVATACPGLALDEIDPDAVDGSSCRVWMADGAGGLVPTEIEGARAAQGLGDGSVVVWGWDGRLTLVERDGARRELAPVAADPWVDVEEAAVAFVAPLPGASALEPGDDRRVMRLELRGPAPLEGEEAGVELVTDATASSPIPVPRSRDVLYVSTAGGIAQIVRVGPEEITPLTNVGLDDVGMGFVPVYGRELVFADAGTRLVWAAREDDADMLFALDLRTGEVEELGPGRFPALATDGSVLAASGSAPDASCAVRYLAGGAP